jgi:hypothetical protein
MLNNWPPIIRFPVFVVYVFLVMIASTILKLLLPRTYFNRLPWRLKFIWH